MKPEKIQIMKRGGAKPGRLIGSNKPEMVREKMTVVKSDWEILERLAEKDGRTRASLTREAVANYVAERLNGPDAQLAIGF